MVSGGLAGFFPCGKVVAAGRWVWALLCRWAPHAARPLVTAQKQTKKWWVGWFVRFVVWFPPPPSLIIKFGKAERGGNLEERGNDCAGPCPGASGVREGKEARACLRAVVPNHQRWQSQMPALGRRGFLSLRLLDPTPQRAWCLSKITHK